MTGAAAHACTLSETYAGGSLGRCRCGEWWMLATARYLRAVLVSASLRERQAWYRDTIRRGLAADLRGAVRLAHAEEMTFRAAEHAEAREKWLAAQKAGRARWITAMRKILTVNPCAYCGAAAQTVDHIIPRARGGQDGPRNLAPACRRCNSAKGKQTPEEWRVARLARGLCWPPDWSEQAA